jgi:tripartite-type tricarboxylate transporter receptor subunit TctC
MMGRFVALVLALAIGAAAFLAPRAASAGESADRYPTRPVRVIVGFPPGGPVDLQARVIMPKLAEALRQPVVIDNRAGADGAVGSELVARAAPDGHTLLYGNAGHVTNQILHANKLPFDAIRDFSPVGLLTTSTYVLIAHPSIPASSVSELVALAKSQPGKLSYGSAGSGSFAHLAGELLKTSASIDLVHVPYKGGAGSLAAVLAAEIPLAFVGVPPTLPHIKSAKVRALAVSSAQRSAALPQVPAVSEAGFPDFDVAARYGFFAPARTPGAIVARLNRELRAILAMSETRSRLAAFGLETIPSTPEEHAAHLRAELARWTPIIKATGMRID